MYDAPLRRHHVDGLRHSIGCALSQPAEPYAATSIMSMSLLAHFLWARQKWNNAVIPHTLLCSTLIHDACLLHLQASEEGEKLLRRADRAEAAVADLGQKLVEAEQKLQERAAAAADAELRAKESDARGSEVSRRAQEAEAKAVDIDARWRDAEGRAKAAEVGGLCGGVGRMDMFAVPLPVAR